MCCEFIKANKVFFFFYQLDSLMAVRAFIIFKKAKMMFERQLPARVHYFVSGSPEQQSTARLLHLENEGKGVFVILHQK